MWIFSLGDVPHNAYIIQGDAMITLLLLAITLSLDSFFTSISYGISNIHIPKSAIFIISFIGTLLLGISLFCSNIIRNFLPTSFCIFSSFLILFLMGFYRMFETIIKRTFKNKKNRLLQVYADEMSADFDHSKDLSIKESVILGTTLSLDSIGSGIGIGLVPKGAIIFLIFSFLSTLLLIQLGYFLGIKMIKKSPNISWISGLMLMALACLRLVS